ncbi:hypothetical protein [Microbacterium sp. E-13]|uniref:hypothetical protein n=1 Tax=Microbacterium sp. E-13 TaxID=3404048 RepID=UPI003CF42664
MGKRSGNDSRCCVPANPPHQWVDFQDESRPAVLDYEAWFASLAPFARHHELGEVDDLLDAAANGKLWDSGDATTPIKPIRENPEIYELRRTALSKKLRFYHGEPAVLPGSLVRLNRHIKSDEQGQQIEIEFAARRYVSGASTSWN